MSILAHELRMRGQGAAGARRCAGLLGMVLCLLAASPPGAGQDLPPGFEGLQHTIERIPLLLRISGYEADGVSAFERGEYQRALAIWQEGLSYSRQVAYPDAEGDFLANLAGAYTQMGLYRQALEHYRQALPIVAEVGRRVGIGAVEGSILANIGSVHLQIGDFDEAQHYFAQALAVFRAPRAQDQGVQSPAQGFPLESLLQGLGSQSLPAGGGGVSREMTRMFNLDKGLGEAMVYSNLGVLYLQLGQPRVGIDYLEKAAAIHDRFGEHERKAANVTNMASAYKQLGQHQKALDYYAQAQKTHREADNKDAVAAVLLNTADVYREMGDTEQALALNDRALALHREIGDRRGEANALGNRGVLLEELGRHREALAVFRDALSISESLDAPLGVFLARRGVASAQAALSRFAEAVAQYQKALETLEGLRGGLAQTGHRMSFVEENLFAYDELLALRMRLHATQPGQGHDREALRVFERKQGRVLLEQIGESAARRAGGHAGELSEEEARLAQLLSASRERLVAERGKPTGARNQDTIRALEREIAAQEAAAADLQRRIKQEAPEYYALRHPAPVSAKALQGQVLRPGEAMLVYGVLKERTALWVITPESFQLFTLEAGEADLQGRVDGLRDALAASWRGVRGQVVSPGGEGVSGAPQDLAAALHDVLIPREVSRRLAETHLLYVVPTGPLYDLPFELLVTQGPGGRPDYLVEKVPIAYLSSASLLRTLRAGGERQRQGSRQPFLAFAGARYGQEAGDETGSRGAGAMPGVVGLQELRERAYRPASGAGFAPLPETVDEAREIAALLEAPDASDPLQLGERAARSRVLALNRAGHLDDFRYLLFATHGVLPGDVDRISQPALVLTSPDPDGKSSPYLTRDDVFGLVLDADLVTLSACNTGRGERVRGEGVVGFTRAFLYAGTPAVAVTLWSVESRSAKELSVGLARHLRAGGGVAEALQRAKLDMIHGELGEAYRHPYYWAPLVVFGEGGAPPEHRGAPIP